MDTVSDAPSPTRGDCKASGEASTAGSPKRTSVADHGSSGKCLRRQGGTVLLLWPPDPQLANDALFALEIRPPGTVLKRPFDSPPGLLMMSSASLIRNPE